MKIGFGAPVAGAWATPEYLAAFSERAEEAGYASLWTFQRLLVPEGSGMEPVYRSVLDAMVALGYIAARTSRIRLGVAILNLPFVSPAYLAKQATTVDVLSGGRQVEHGHAEPDRRRARRRIGQGGHRVQDALVHVGHAGAVRDEQPLEAPDGRVTGLLGPGGEAGQVFRGRPGARDGGAETNFHESKATGATAGRPWSIWGESG